MGVARTLRPKRLEIVARRPEFDAFLSGQFASKHSWRHITAHEFELVEQKFLGFVETAPVAPEGIEGVGDERLEPFQPLL